jgi:hypothetical protein
MSRTTKSLDDIIRERTAGLPPEQQERAIRRTIIEVLLTQPTVPLTNYARLYVAWALEEAWLPPKELAKLKRQRLLKSIEDQLGTVKWVRKNVKHDQRPLGPATEAILPFIVKDGNDLASGFPTAKAMEQFMKRARAERRQNSAKKKA